MVFSNVIFDVTISSQLFVFSHMLNCPLVSLIYVAWQSQHLAASFKIGFLDLSDCIALCLCSCFLGGCETQVYYPKVSMTFCKYTDELCEKFQVDQVKVLRPISNLVLLPCREGVNGVN